MSHYGHSLIGRPASDWEPLREHLERVATGVNGMPGAAEFAAAFGSEDWGRLLGLWHDLGKYSAEFQERIRHAGGHEAHIEHAARVDHSTAGAQHAVRQCGPEIGRLIAYAIAGHHGGLPDAADEEGGGVSGLNDRLRKQIPKWAAAPVDLLNQPPPALPPMLNFRGSQADVAFRLSVFCRMLFSCLVDADYLATEQFMSADRAEQRPRDLPSVADLLPLLEAELQRLAKSSPDTLVNRLRAEVQVQCRAKAELPLGLFSLTVPTGGGKTLASLAFALNHAVHHGLRRVIYAIPFTSIIEQNAEVFCRIFQSAGRAAVLEHHSNLDPGRETFAMRLAAENWDAPLVVTTNVQLYESLFASQPSRCRKLHRIARSVIVLDEAQSMPVELLEPTLAMLQELCHNYACSVVLCTATQPAVTHRPDFHIGLRNVCEIVDDPPALYTALRRVECERRGLTSDDELVAALSGEPRALCVVNTRAHAAMLYERMKHARPGAVLHLSAQMCPAHRSDMLTRIRKRLDTPQAPCIVISTQLVEAGVDLDFPVVYRAMAGLDSIAQAAGRCNREGRLPRGRLVVFETAVQGTHTVRQAAGNALEIASTYADLLDPQAVEAYFEFHFWRRKDEWDKQQIMRRFSIDKHGPQFQFRQVAAAYRLIEQELTPVVVPYGDEGRALAADLKRVGGLLPRELFRRMQRYSVGVYEAQLRVLADQAAATEVQEGVYVLAEHAYDLEIGLKTDTAGLDPATLVI